METGLTRIMNNYGKIKEGRDLRVKCYIINRPFVKITNLCIPYNLLNIPHLPSVGDFDEWAIKLKITTYLGDYSLG